MNEINNWSRLESDMKHFLSTIRNSNVDCQLAEWETTIIRPQTDSINRRDRRDKLIKTKTIDEIIYFKPSDRSDCQRNGGA